MTRAYGRPIPTWGRDTQTYWTENFFFPATSTSRWLIPADILIDIDAGKPLVWLAGSHIGCLELYGSERVSSTRDLKGKTVAITSLRDPTNSLHLDVRRLCGP